MISKFSDKYKTISLFFRKIYYNISKLDQYRTQNTYINISLEENFFENFSQYDIELIKDFSVSIECGLTFYNEYIKVQKSLFVLEAAKYLDIDIMKLSKLLNWKEFEDLISKIFEKNEFKVIKNFRFTDHSNYYRKTNQKRYEIDVIAILGRLILLIDAKHWNCRTNNLSAINRAAKLQSRRMRALIKNPDVISKLITILLNQNELQKIKAFMPFKLIPMIVTLIENKVKLSYIQVPIVSIFHLNRFIQEFDFNEKFFIYEIITNITIQKNLTNIF